MSKDTDTGYRLDEDFQEFDEALEELLEVTKNMAADAESSGNQQAASQMHNTRQAVEDLRDSYDDIDQEIRLSREWINEVRQAEEHFFPRYLDTIDATLQNLEQVSQSLDREPVVYRETDDRRGFMKWLALLLGGFGVAFAANELSDEYDVDVNVDSPVDIDRNEDTGFVGGTGSGYILDPEEYELLIVDEDVIEDVGREYRRYGSEIGQLGDEIDDVLDSGHESLLMGYDDETEYVQMTNMGDDLLLDFGFESGNMYTEAKQIAYDV